MTAAALASSPPPLPGFLNAIASPLEHYGLWAIGLLITLEDFGIPVPGETILIAGSIYAGAGRLNIVAVGLVGFIAAIIGDNIGFAIGHFGGRRLALRWGKYVFLTEERLDKAEAFFDRRGAIVITFARFVEGLRQANGIIAGITGMHWLRFLIFNAIGAALWVGTWVTAGYFAGNHITAIYHYITLYSYYALFALVLVILAFVIRHLRRRRRRLAAAQVSRVSEAHASEPISGSAQSAPEEREAAGAESDNQAVAGAESGNQAAAGTASDPDQAAAAPDEHPATADRHAPGTS
jgi:membrane protein DedA with SNARE-associated domain